MPPHIRILSTGGTIANMPEGRIHIDELLERVRAHPYADSPDRYAKITTQEVTRQGGEVFTPDEWVKIASAVQEAARDDTVDGMVVTHGTYTAEETAYFLNLTVNTDKPVVVACAQRKHGLPSSDSDRNLVDAVRVAASPDAIGKGVCLVMNETIHSARDVTKSNRRLEGFTSRSLGPLGTIEEDVVSFHRAPLRRHTYQSEFSVPDLPVPKVDVVSTYAGADGTAVKAFVEAGVRGLVVNGFSYSGNPHALQRPELDKALDAGVPVVLINRGGDGRMPILDPSERFVRGDSLTFQKARVLLSVALTRTTDKTELQRIFSEY